MGTEYLSIADVKESGEGYPVNNKELLLLSYLHWLDNLREMLSLLRSEDKFQPRIDISNDGCVLCYHYRVRSPDIKGVCIVYTCYGCPIMCDSAGHNCRNTPYKKVVDAWKIMIQMSLDYNIYDIDDIIRLITHIWEECLYLKRLYHREE